MNAADDAPRWASLPPDLVRLIGWRVLAEDLLDYVRFRAACPLWRSCTVCPRGRGLVDARFHPRRWLLLPEGSDLFPGHSELRGYIRFFNVSTGLSVRARLPLFENHLILDAVDGLILLLQEQDSTVRLLHPFTGDIAEFPSFTTLVTHFEANPYLSLTWEVSEFRSISSTSFSVSVDGAITVMIALTRQFHVAFATSGRDRQWHVSSWNLPPLWRSVSFQGRLYIFERSKLTNDPQIFQIDPPQHKEIGLGLSSLSPPKLIATCPGKIQYPYYLVECDGAILVLGCRDEPRSLHMLVYRLSDLILKIFTPVTSIGGNVLFVHDQRSLSVSSRALPTIVGDTIVKTKPMEGVPGKYQLNGGTWLPVMDKCIRFCGYEPSPGNLIFRIFWYHDNWSKLDIGLQMDTTPSLAKRNWRDEA